MSFFTYLYIYFQSNGLELFFYIPFLKTKKISIIQKVVFFSICNAITHPIVFFGFMASPLTVLQSILWAEFFAIVAETLLIYRFYPQRVSFLKVLLISSLANFVSWQMAPIFTGLIVKILF